MTTERPGRTVYVVCCGSPPTRDVGRLVDLGHEHGWDVCVIGTPSATKWMDLAALEAQTGHPVRTEYKRPEEPDVLPPPDGIIVAPATVNTTVKWALGICDTLALGLIVEAIGLKLPLVAMPCTNAAHAAHPGFRKALSDLRDWGVDVLFDGAPPEDFPWRLAADAMRRQIDGRP